MLRWTVLSAALCCGAMMTTVRAEEEPAVEAQEGIAAVLAELIDRHKLPAMAAATFSSDGITEAAVIGKRSKLSGTAAQQSDRFHIGSCTKPITSTLAAVLVNDGAIRWDSTIGEVFADLEGLNEAYRGVTLEQLLRQRGGIAAFTDGKAPENELLDGLAGTAREQRAAFARRVLSAESAGNPGDFRYSNGGYGIAAAMLEKVSDQAWEDLLRERIFGPVGISSGGVGWPATKDRTAEPLGHVPFGDTVAPLPVGHPYKLEPALAPAGDVHLSIEDFARFGMLHLRGLRGGLIRGFTIPKETFELLHTATGGDGRGSDYAMGWYDAVIAGRTITMHNGSTGTFFAVIALDVANDLGIVVTTNAGTGENACMEFLATSLPSR